MPESCDIENGFAIVKADEDLLCQPDGPTAIRGGSVTLTRLPLLKTVKWYKRLFTPDRFRLKKCQASNTEIKLFFSDSKRPFLTLLGAPMDSPLTVVTERLLVCPLRARIASSLQRVLPMSLKNAICTTQLQNCWCVMGTATRTTRVVLESTLDELTVKQEAVVAWTTPEPRGFCPKLRVRDMFLPRPPKNLGLIFHGPGVVWLQGK